MIKREEGGRIKREGEGRVRIRKTPLEFCLQQKVASLASVVGYPFV